MTTILLWSFTNTELSTTIWSPNCFFYLLCWKPRQRSFEKCPKRSLMPTLFLWKKTKKAIKVSKLASLAFTYLIEEFSFPALLTKSSKEGMPACNRSKKISWLSMHFCKEKMYDQHQFWQQNKSNFFCFFSMHGGMTTTTYIMNQQQMWNLRKWSHHFSTLSEYPIISCCVKTIAVNQGEEATKTMLKGVQQHEKSIVFMDLIEYG